MSGRSQVTAITIVAESILERRLLDVIAACGARGWTITAARGSGPRNRRVSEIEGGNIRIETLVPEPVVDRIWSALEADFFPHYAVIAWANPVEVQRSELFGESGHFG